MSSQHAVALVAVLLALFGSACSRVGFDDRPLGASDGGRDVEGSVVDAAGDATADTGATRPTRCG